MPYSLKIGVKIGLYCVKYVGVVVCTGVLIKVSYVGKIWLIVFLRVRAHVCVYVIEII